MEKQVIQIKKVISNLGIGYSDRVTVVLMNDTIVTFPEPVISVCMAGGHTSFATEHYYFTDKNVRLIGSGSVSYFDVPQYGQPMYFLDYDGRWMKTSPVVSYALCGGHLYSVETQNSYYVIQQARNVA